ncbi:DUF1456 family protein [Niallia taxi]|uniref:DUF1456 family protein n=1 Tax=Niallia taxi TaxID=2499688 RepID=UPI00124742A1|nr:DUF1456 family protein [Niallia taxi]MCM3214637.1 DUF1456 family protein [Niallia taxi]MDK8642596.1 DUF1456 family protein [Niallia taxi]MED4040261.1 DUF1456 family protein [Niallia taxi]MED4056194.1 DUF1456 family protein [Niallia taxi]MED4119679.1 DUF1456 family protein [Niallia taxi]
MEIQDMVIRLRYALEIKNKEMVEIFKLGGVNVTVPEVIEILTKSDDEEEDNDDKLQCTTSMFDSFLNGLIIYKRGVQEPKPGMPNPPVQSSQKREHINNLLLKRVKIAMSLTTDDMLDIFENAGLTVTKGELGALLRKEGHKNYKECGDKFARNFLKGLAIQYRG